VSRPSQTRPEIPPARLGLLRPPAELFARLEASGWARIVDFEAAIGSRFYLFRQGLKRLLVEVYPEAGGYEVWEPTRIRMEGKGR